MINLTNQEITLKIILGTEEPKVSEEHLLEVRPNPISKELALAETGHLPTPDDTYKFQEALPTKEMEPAVKEFPEPFPSGISEGELITTTPTPQISLEEVKPPEPELETKIRSRTKSKKK